MAAPRRVHLAALARGGDPAAIAELAAAPPLSPHAAHVWRYFVDLSRTRPVNGMTVCHLSRLEVRAWEQDELITLDPWERQALQKVDAAFVATLNSADTSPPAEQ